MKKNKIFKKIILIFLIIVLFLTTIFSTIAFKSIEQKPNIIAKSKQYKQKNNLQNPIKKYLSNTSLQQNFINEIENYNNLESKYEISKKTINNKYSDSNNINLSGSVYNHYQKGKHIFDTGHTMTFYFSLKVNGNVKASDTWEKYIEDDDSYGWADVNLNFNVINIKPNDQIAIYLDKVVALGTNDAKLSMMPVSVSESKKIINLPRNVQSYNINKVSLHLYYDGTDEWGKNDTRVEVKNIDKVTFYITTIFEQNNSYAQTFYANYLYMTNDVLQNNNFDSWTLKSIIQFYLQKKLINNPIWLTNPTINKNNKTINGVFKYFKTNQIYSEPIAFAIPIKIINFNYFLKASTNSATKFNIDANGNKKYWFKKPATKLEINDNFIKCLTILKNQKYILNEVLKWTNNLQQQKILKDKVLNNLVNIFNKDIVKSYIQTNNFEKINALVLPNYFLKIYKSNKWNEYFHYQDYLFVLKNSAINFQDFYQNNISINLVDILKYEYKINDNNIENISSNQLLWNNQLSHFSLKNVKDNIFLSNLRGQKLSINNENLKIIYGLDLTLIDDERKINHNYYYQRNSLNVARDVSFVLSDGTILNQDYKVISSTTMEIGTYAYKQIRYKYKKSINEEYIIVRKDDDDNWFSDKFKEKLNKLVVNFDEENIEYVFDQEMNLIINPYSKTISSNIDTNNLPSGIEATPIEYKISGIYQGKNAPTNIPIGANMDINSYNVTGIYNNSLSPDLPPGISAHPYQYRINSLLTVDQYNALPQSLKHQAEIVKYQFLGKIQNFLLPNLPNGRYVKENNDKIVYLLNDYRQNSGFLTEHSQISASRQGVALFYNNKIYATESNGRNPGVKTIGNTYNLNTNIGKYRTYNTKFQKLNKDRLTTNSSNKFLSYLPLHSKIHKVDINWMYVEGKSTGYQNWNTMQHITSNGVASFRIKNFNLQFRNKNNIWVNVSSSQKYLADKIEYANNQGIINYWIKIYIVPTFYNNKWSFQLFIEGKNKGSYDTVAAVFIKKIKITTSNYQVYGIASNVDSNFISELNCQPYQYSLNTTLTKTNYDLLEQELKNKAKITKYLIQGKYQGKNSPNLPIGIRANAASWKISGIYRGSTIPSNLPQGAQAVPIKWSLKSIGNNKPISMVELAGKPRYSIKTIVDIYNGVEKKLESWNDGFWSHARKNDVALFDGVFGADMNGNQDGKGLLNQGSHKIKITLFKQNILNKNKFNIYIDFQPVDIEVNSQGNLIKTKIIDNNKYYDLYYSDQSINFQILDLDIAKAESYILDSKGNWYEIPLDIKTYLKDNIYYQYIDSTMNYFGFAKIIIQDRSGNKKIIFFKIDKTSKVIPNLQITKDKLKEIKNYQGQNLYIFHQENTIFLIDPLVYDLKLFKISKTKNGHTFKKNVSNLIQKYNFEFDKNYHYGQTIENAKNNKLTYIGDELKPFMKNLKILNKWIINNSKINIIENGLYEFTFKTKLSNKNSITKYFYLNKNKKINGFQNLNFKQDKSQLFNLPILKNKLEFTNDIEIDILDKFIPFWFNFEIKNIQVEWAPLWNSEFKKINNHNINHEGKYKVIMIDYFNNKYVKKFLLLDKSKNSNDRIANNMLKIYAKENDEKTAFWKGKVIWWYYRYEDSDHAIWEKNNFINEAMKKGLTIEEAEIAYKHIKKDAYWDGNPTNLPGDFTLKELAKKTIKDLMQERGFKKIAGQYQKNTYKYLKVNKNNKFINHDPKNSYKDLKVNKNNKFINYDPKTSYKNLKNSYTNLNENNKFINHNSKKSYQGLIIGGTILGLLVITLIIFLYWRRIKHKKIK